MAVNQLKIVVSILAELSDGKEFPKYSDYDVDEKTFTYIIKAMQDDGLISGVIFLNTIGRDYPFFKTYGVALTIKGMKELNENSTLMKTYKGLKEIREWLPF